MAYPPNNSKNPPGTHNHQTTTSSNSTSFIRDVLNLPKYVTMGTLQLIIDVIDDDQQMTEMYGMIQDAMETGEGYGVNEYRSKQEFESDLDGGPAFGVFNTATGKMVAAYALAHSKYYRGTDNLAVTPYVVIRKSHRAEGLGAFLTDTCIDSAKRLNYVGMYIDTFTDGSVVTASQKILDKRCKYICTLPLGGRMPDGRIVRTRLYYTDLTVDNVRSPLGSIVTASKL